MPQNRQYIQGKITILNFFACNQNSAKIEKLDDIGKFQFNILPQVKQDHQDDRRRNCPHGALSQAQRHHAACLKMKSRLIKLHKRFSLRYGIISE